MKTALRRKNHESGKQSKLANSFFAIILFTFLIAFMSAAGCLLDFIFVGGPLYLFEPDWYCKIINYNFLHVLRHGADFKSAFFYLSLARGLLLFAVYAVIIYFLARWSELASKVTFSLLGINMGLVFFDYYGDRKILAIGFIIGYLVGIVFYSFLGVDNKVNHEDLTSWEFRRLLRCRKIGIGTAVIAAAINILLLVEYTMDSLSLLFFPDVINVVLVLFVTYIFTLFAWLVISILGEKAITDERKSMANRKPLYSDTAIA